MGQVFKFNSPFVSISAADVVVVEYRTPNDKSAIVHLAALSQSSNDDTSDQIAFVVNRGTPASAGTTVGAVAVNAHGASAAGTSSYGGTKATSVEVLERFAANALSGWQYLPTPEFRWELKGGQTIEILTAAAPASATSFSGTLTIEEIG
tara:strand:+ start:227 stop:676 length:450 start_codon:yes stop_codon:yes gene_type:complete